MERVVDPGPIDYEQIELYKDRDLEEALEQDGLDPEAMKYRLIELSGLRDTRDEIDAMEALRPGDG